MKARIYKPTRNAMQSGRSNTKKWLLEFAPSAAQSHDPLMGWTSSSDTRRQFRLRFDTLDEAVAYAKRRAIPYEVAEPHARRVRPKSYAENFRWQRPS